MTKKRYITLASDLAGCRPFVAKRSTREQRACMRTWLQARAAIIASLQADNPNFCKDKFIEATEK